MHCSLEILSGSWVGDLLQVHDKCAYNNMNRGKITSIIESLEGTFKRKAYTISWPEFKMRKTPYLSKRLKCSDFINNTTRYSSTCSPSHSPECEQCFEGQCCKASTLMVMATTRTCGLSWSSGDDSDCLIVEQIWIIMFGNCNIYASTLSNASMFLKIVLLAKIANME